MNHIIRLSSLAFFLFFIFRGVSTYALEKTWTGASDNHWTNGSNWNPPGIPTLLDSVAIPDSTTTPNDPEAYTGDAQCGNLAIQSDGFMELSGGYDLNCDGNIDIIGTLSVTSSGSTIFCSGNWTNTGTFEAGTGTISFDGESGTQTIDAGAHNFFNVEINNSGSSVQLVADMTQSVGGLLTMTSGMLDLNAYTWTLGADLVYGTPATISIGSGQINGGIPYRVRLYSENSLITATGNALADIIKCFAFELVPGSFLKSSSTPATITFSRDVNIYSASTFSHNYSTKLKATGQAGGGELIIQKDIYDFELDAPGSCIGLRTSVTQSTGGVLTLAGGTLNLNEHTWTLGADLSYGTPATVAIGSGQLDASPYLIRLHGEDSQLTVSGNSSRDIIKCQGIHITPGSFVKNTTAVATITIDGFHDVRIYGTGDFVHNGSTKLKVIRSGGLLIEKDLYDLELAGPGTITSYFYPLHIDGDFTVISGTFSTGGNDMLVAGNWMNTGTFNHGNATVTFEGSGDQVIGNSENFYGLCINKTNGSLNLADGTNVTVSGPFSVTGMTSTIGGTSNTGYALTLQGDVNIPGMEINHVNPLTLSGSGTVLFNNVAFNNYIDSPGSKFLYVTRPALNSTFNNCSFGPGPNGTDRYNIHIDAVGSTINVIHWSGIGGGEDFDYEESGTVLWEGTCYITPTVLDFDSVEISHSKDTTFTIVNMGAGMLSGTVGESCSPFSLISGGGPYSLATGESLAVTVRFEPMSGETLFCTVETGDSACSDIYCTGVGFDPLTGIVSRRPVEFELYQSIPNPFNTATRVFYSVPEYGGYVTLRVFDVRGQLVRTLVNSMQTAGEKHVTWDGRNDKGSSVSTGIYFYRMRAAGFEMTKKMVLLK